MPMLWAWIPERWRRNWANTRANHEKIAGTISSRHEKPPAMFQQQTKGVTFATFQCQHWRKHFWEELQIGWVHLLLLFLNSKIISQMYLSFYLAGQEGGTWTTNQNCRCRQLHNFFKLLFLLCGLILVCLSAAPQFSLMYSCSYTINVVLIVLPIVVEHATRKL
jgi:hypothetical protein